MFQTSDRTHASQVWATEFGFCGECGLMPYTPYPAHVCPSHIWTFLRLQCEKRRYEPQARILPQTLKPEAQVQLLLLFFTNLLTPWPSTQVCLCLLPSSVTGSTASQFPRQSCFPMPCLPRALCFHAALCLRPLGLLPLSTSYIVGANITGPAAARTSFWEVVVLRPSFHQE